LVVAIVVPAKEASVNDDKNNSVPKKKDARVDVAIRAHVEGGGDDVGSLVVEGEARAEVFAVLEVDVFEPHVLRAKKKNSRR
jgi:hypothetical protein